ncbi:hypothetical protein [Methylocella sp.]|uniref:hypothetical protein n=1 Tax=Methylocella sp. TaxID=1978226 RepID=UPI0035AEE200
MRACPGLTLACAAALALVAAGPARSGVRLLAPGEEMAPLDAFRFSRPGAPGSDKAPQLAPVRVAAEGEAGALERLTPRAAPIEIVEPSQNPDLVVDIAARLVRARGEIIARDVGADEVAAVVDRFALGEALPRAFAQRSLPVRVTGSGTRHGSEAAQIEVSGVAGRALVLFSVSGEGVVRELYPLGGEPRVVAEPTFRASFGARPPYGADLIVAVAAAAPMPALEDGVRELAGRPAAGQVLQLLALATPPDARIGAVVVPGAP